MRIGGFLKFSLVDYPGKIAAVVFTRGCNFRCPYCHNRDLVIPSLEPDSVTKEEILGFLERRCSQLQGVVVTGGEPTLQKDVILFLQEIKRLGYAVKLDTNGSRPEVLRDVIEQRAVDMIAMDVKAPLCRYAQVAGVQVDTAKIQESIELILSSGISYMFRTTVVKALLDDDDISDITTTIHNARPYILQDFVPRDTVLDRSLLKRPKYSHDEFSRLQERWERH